MIPLELQYKILYEFKGLEHPHAKIMRRYITIYNNAYFLSHSFVTYSLNRFVFSKLNTRLKERFYHL
jgi:hypothetical protein